MAHTEQRGIARCQRRLQLLRDSRSDAVGHRNFGGLLAVVPRAQIRGDHRKLRRHRPGIEQPEHGKIEEQFVPVDLTNTNEEVEHLSETDRRQHVLGLDTEKLANL